MAESKVFYDLDFHFSSGEPVFAMVLEGRDRIQDTPEVTKVTVCESDGSETTLTIQRDKLNYVRSTRRIVQPDRFDLNGMPIEE